ncbi:NAD(P)/FAD-dependent oxidoreductase [Sagittula sp. SSi028]|uniref:NAD(P)/FAD-dependent oxidoreductase n=1 Tax=Sagittula sp. SSi028 TaxID=3400636 RepID=UPI003AF95923
MKHVAIIGAGIVGVSTAIWLQRAGCTVTLIDAKAPGEGASHGNGGVLASAAVVPVSVPGLLAQAPRMLLDPDQPLFLRYRYLPKLIPWGLRFLREATAEGVRKRARAATSLIGDSLNDHLALASGTGAERYIVPTDYLYLYGSRAEYEADALTWQVRREMGFRWDLLEEAPLRAFDPCYGPDMRFAARLPDHGRIRDPGRYVKTLADHVAAEGGRVLRANVADIIRENGRVTGVRMGGDRLDCDAVVLAAGAWSNTLAKRLGLKIPLDTERGYHLELYGPNIMPKTPLMVASGKFVVTPMDGRLRLAGVVEFGGLQAGASRAPFALLDRHIRKALPQLRWEKTVEWMGHRPSMSDSLPVIGPAATAPGAYLAFGHDHVGLTGGPKTGRMLAQMICGQTPNIDMAPFSPARFDP